MDALIQFGVDWIVAVQGLGAWLETPMEFFSFLGTEDFFLLVLPLIYWCINAGLGMRVGFMLITSVYINDIFKLLFAGPRPYWVSDKVIAFTAESSFGVPSGHAQNAVGVWGTIASGVHKQWAWIVAFALAFFIGFSRWYLGVHFPHDVIVGWLLGFILLWLFAKYWDIATAWLKQKTMGSQILIGFIVSLIFIALGSFSVGRLDGYILPEAYQTNALRIADEVPDPVSLEGTFTSAGTFFGLAVGAAWIMSRGGYQATGPIGTRTLRYVVGLIGILILWMGLGILIDKLFPNGSDALLLVLRYVRYTLVGFWLFGGAPWLFFRIKLAKSNM